MQRFYVVSIHDFASSNLPELLFIYYARHAKLFHIIHGFDISFIFLRSHAKYFIQIKFKWKYARQL